LVVDGSKIMREKMIRYLELANIFEAVLEAGSVKESKRILRKEKIDVLLFDIQLPGISGIDLVPFSRNLLHKPVLILCSNYKLPQYLSIYEKLSINYFFDKSEELPELKMCIKKIAREKRSDTNLLIRYKNSI